MSKYLYNIKLRPDNREPIVGGMSLATFMTMNASDSVLGGSQDGLRKISHLSVPVGLVIIKSNMTNPMTKIIEGNDIDEHIFDKLYRNTNYQTNSNASKSKRHSRKIIRK